MADPSEASSAGDRRSPPMEPPLTVEEQTKLVQLVLSAPVDTPALQAALAEAARVFGGEPEALPSTVGDELDDFCVACGRQVKARLALRTVRLEESGVDMADVLLAACTGCGAATSLLPVSAIRLRDAQARAAGQ